MNKKTAKKIGGSETTKPTVGKAVSDAGKELVRGTAYLVEETAGAIGTTGKIFGHIARTTENVTGVLGNITTEVLKTAGDATTLSMKPVISSLRVVSALLKRAADRAESEAEIRKEKDNFKNEAIKDIKVKEKLIEKEKEKRIAEAGLKIAKIKLEFELKKAKDLNAAEIRMAKDNRDQKKERALLEVKKELSNVENNIIKSGATCIKNLNNCKDHEDCTQELSSNKKFEEFIYKGRNGINSLCNYFTLCEKYGPGKTILLRRRKRRYCNDVKKMVRHANEYANSKKNIGGSRKKQYLKKKSIKKNNKNNKNNKNKSRKKTKKRKV